jgi:hypothetical protein
MLENVPQIVSILFIAMTLVFLYYFWKMLRKDLGNQIANRAIIGLSTWSVLVGVLASQGFYLDFESKPPRFVLVVFPILAVIIFLLFKYPNEIKKLDLVSLTYLHLVRVPVEIFIFFWFTYGIVPQEMTFEGRNFDILSGLTAPLVAYFIVQNGAKEHLKMVYSWNILTLLLVINIVATAVLSLPSSFQVFGVDQPNIAVIHFPFVLLPAVIVPLVVFCHAVSIIQLRALKD